jgi:hypothetical protein
VAEEQQSLRLHEWMEKDSSLQVRQLGNSGKKTIPGRDSVSDLCLYQMNVRLRKIQIFRRIEVSVRWHLERAVKML